MAKFIIDQNAEPTDSHEAPPLPSLPARRLPENVLPAPYVLSGLAEFFGENTANETIEAVAKDALALGDDPDNSTAPFTSLGKRRAIDELNLSSQKRARHDEWKHEFGKTFDEFQNPVTRDILLQAGFIGYATKDFGSADEPLPEEPLPDEPPEQILEELLEEIAALIEPQVIATDISEAFSHAYWAASTKARAEITTWTEHYLDLPAESSSNNQHPDVFLMTALRAALLQFANTDHDSQTRIIALIQRCIPNLPPIYLLLLEMVMDNDPQNL